MSRFPVVSRGNGRAQADTAPDEHDAEPKEHGAEPDEHGAEPDEHGAEPDEHGAEPDGSGAAPEAGGRGGSADAPRERSHQAGRRRVLARRRGRGRRGKPPRRSRRRFPVALRGYDRAQVDEVLDRIAVTMGRGAPRPVPESGDRPAQPITADEVRESRFDAVLRGYDRRPVDEALREHIRRLAAAGPRSSRPRRPPMRPGWLIGWIEKAQFTGVRIRTGYDVRDVDAFLERVVAGLRGVAPPVSARDVRESVFRTVRFAPGYVEREVDAFLDHLASALDGG
jgi:DivIVA domain-containing protein